MRRCGGDFANDGKYKFAVLGPVRSPRDGVSPTFSQGSKARVLRVEGSHTRR